MAEWVFEHRSTGPSPTHNNDYTTQEPHSSKGRLTWRHVSAHAIVALMSVKRVKALGEIKATPGHTELQYILKPTFGL